MENEKIVFILGIMPRSGTHFIANLICKHQNCQSTLIPEDFFIANVKNLNRFSNDLVHTWKKQKHFEIENISELQRALKFNLGRSITEFIVNSVHKKKKWDDKKNKDLFYVTKTPSTEGIQFFDDFFNDQKLIVIIRDIRTLMESFQKSFANDFELIAREWVKQARALMFFSTKKSKYHLVKYEELHTDYKKEITKVIQFLGLSMEEYDMNSAEKLPVVGSSNFKRGEGKIHWTPVKKDDSFQPLNSADNWPRWKHERINWMCKKEMLHFDYKPKTFQHWKFIYTIWNIYKDIIWFVYKKRLRIKI